MQRTTGSKSSARSDPDDGQPWRIPRRTANFACATACPLRKTSAEEFAMSPREPLGEAEGAQDRSDPSPGNAGKRRLNVEEGDTRPLRPDDNRGFRRSAAHCRPRGDPE